MIIDVSVIQPLLQNALDLMATASCWERKAAMKAHICGLQGEKRRLRYLYREANNYVDMTEHLVKDVLKIEMSAQQGSGDVSSLLTPETCMEGIIDKLWTIRMKVHKIANDMVAAGFKEFANPLYCYAEKLFKCIGYLQRMDDLYKSCKYDMVLISRYQVADENVHDEYEPKEEGQGYKD